MDALELLEQLKTGPEDGDGYAPSEFAGWLDRDGDGCNTRAEVLTSESREPVVKAEECRVRRGKWVSSYDGQRLTRARYLGVDRLVSLAEAWGSGAKLWTQATRDRFSNDLGYRFSLNAVSTDSQRARAGGEPTEWLPREQFRCRYAKQYTAVKFRWSLQVDPDERSTLRALIRGCDDRTIIEPGRADIDLEPSGPLLVGDWQMNESSGSTMIDASRNGLDGDIGSSVRINRPTPTSRGYHFDGPVNVKNQGRLVLVPDTPMLDPGTGTYSVAIRFKTNASHPNILQKGQSEDAGGYWKLVIHTGWPRCHYRDENHNTKAIGFDKSPNPNAKVNDGDWHTLRCVRNLTSVCVSLDEGTPNAMQRCIKGTLGRIDNKWPLSIGGKLRCDAAQASKTCDYFNGDIDWVRIEKP